MADPLIQRFENIATLINRTDHFTLRQKVTLRKLLGGILQTFIENTGGGGTTPAELYGTSLRYGSVIWRTGLTFDVTPLGYYIDGEFYTAPGGEFTLSAADGTNPRIDLFIADTDGNVSVIEGTPAADPVKPTVSEEAGQIGVSFVTVPAGATEPEGVGTNILVYDEDLGESTEWDLTTFNVGDTSIVTGSTEDPFTGTKHIDFPNMPAGSGIVFDTTVAASMLSPGTVDKLAFRIKCNDIGRRGSIYIQPYDSNNSPTAPRLTLSDGTYGLDLSNSASYQTIAIPMTDLNPFNANEIAKFDFFTDRRGSYDFFLDKIEGIVFGSSLTIINNYTVGLTEEEVRGTIRPFYVQQYMENGTLTDGATITWNLDTDPIANVTLGGNRTINFSNARPGGTYILKVVQDGTGSRTITWDADIYWASGTAPTLSTAANAVDVISFVAFEEGKLYGVVAGQAFA